MLPIALSISAFLNLIIFGFAVFLGLASLSADGFAGCWFVGTGLSFVKQLFTCWSCSYWPTSIKEAFPDFIFMPVICSWWSLLD